MRRWSSPAVKAEVVRLPLGTPFPGDQQGGRGTTRPGVTPVGGGGMCRVRLYLVAAEAENGTAGWFGSESRPGSELPAPLLRSGVTGLIGGCVWSLRTQQRAHCQCQLF